MTFSPELESKFATLINSYPAGRHRAALIPMLLFAQDEVGAITDEVVDEIAKRLGITPLQIGEVVTYYSMLHRERRGMYKIQVCTNVSCMLVGGNEILEHAERKLGVRRGETAADGQFSIEEVECMGACSWAPALQVNYDFHHFVTPEKLDRLIDDLRKVH
jgi:NADH-quinone oxidoreductase subunit E